MTDDIAQLILAKLDKLEEGQTELRGEVGRLEVLLEDTNSRLDATLEIVGSISTSVLQIPQMTKDIAELKTDNKLIKMVVTDTNHDIKKLDKRVTRLETVAQV